MSEFRVAFDKASQQRRDRKIRLAAWGTILLLLAVAVVGILSARSSDPHVNVAFTWFSVLMVVGAIVGAYFIGIRLSLERLERDIVFLLTEKDLVRRRAGWPDVRIDFSEISSLLERKDWLVVESAQPVRKIAIPREVEGFASLRAELAKHGPVIVSQKRSILGAIPTVASLLCWGLMLWSKDARVARVAGTIALILLGWGSVSIDKQMRQSPKRLFIWICLGPLWVAAILLAYLKVTRTL